MTLTKDINQRYYTSIILSAIYMIICIMSLIFATGVGNGIKLDDNQLPGYMIAITTFCVILFSFFIKTLKFRKLNIVVLLFLDLTFLMFFFTGIISFNEAMILFIFPMMMLTGLILFYACIFIIFTRSKRR